MDPQVKPTSEVPASVLTPDSVETRLGMLRFFDGFPDEETVRKAYDNLDIQRGVQAFHMSGTVINPDTSADVYFGPEAPVGH